MTDALDHVVSMKIQWEIEADDIARVRAFYDKHKNNEFVAHR
jgi:hypothetical protein